jgi:hypothetical protein
LTYQDQVKILAAVLAVVGIRGALQANDLDGMQFGSYCLEAAEVILSFEERSEEPVEACNDPACDCEPDPPPAV